MTWEPVTTPKRLPLREATWLADELVRMLAPGCARIAVAGSVRRRKAVVHDIELVAIPVMAPVQDLLGEVRQQSALDLLVGKFIGQGILGYGPKPVNGPKYKRLWAPSHAVQLDLFVVTPETWGNLFAIRTGDAAFSRLLVTQRSAGGLLPAGMHHADGKLWRDGEPVPCPEEETFFAALGIAAPPFPAERTEHTARRLARELRGAS